MFDDAIEFLGILFFPLIICAALFGAVAWAVLSLEKHECGIYEKQTGRATTWVFATCYVDTPNGVLTYSEHKATLVAREGLREQVK